MVSLATSQKGEIFIMDTKEIHEALAKGVSFHLLKVTNAGTGVRRPGICITAAWIPDMGFIPGALVQALPEPDGGLVFILCDENIRRYSELDAATQVRGGKLIQANNAVARQKERPALITSGQILYDAGFSIGDTLIARYEYGLIRLWKLPGTVKVIHTKSVVKSGKPVLQLTLAGEWLSKLGYMPDALFTAFGEKGCITFKLQDEAIEKYSDLVRFARKNKMKLLQVRTVPVRGKRMPRIDITGACLHDVGVSAGDPLLAFCNYGLIKLQTLDVGF